MAFPGEPVPQPGPVPDDRNPGLPGSDAAALRRALESTDDASASAHPTRTLLVQAATVSHGGAENGRVIPEVALEDVRLSFHEHGYDVLDLLGHGGMGVVYKAYQRRLDRHVALKTLPPAFTVVPEMLQRMRNEVAILARVVDARVLEIYDVFEANGAPVLVMPYIDGPDLGRVIEFRRRARKAEGTTNGSNRTLAGDPEYLDAILPILDQLVGAVAALHQAGVIHRDLKPPNVLIDMKGAIRLADFGLAREGAGIGLTRTGAAIGTRGYMSPEQWEGAKEIGPRTDVFALGVTLYEALTLELPYGRDPIAHRARLAPPPSRRAPIVSRHLDAVILKAIDPEPKGRFASAAELQAEWSRIRGGQAARVRPAGRLRHLGRSLRIHPATVANLGLLGLVISVGALVWQLSPVPMFDSQHRRLVRVETKPAGARFVAVPLERYTGVLSAVPAAPVAKAPASLRLRPGDYLIVAEWPDHRFHEVYRHVPEPGEVPEPFRHVRFTEDQWRAVILPEIEAPPEDVLSGMVFFAGTDLFAPPRDPQAGLVLNPGPIADFYLDATEVTNATRAKLAEKPVPPVDPDLPVRSIQFNAAVHEAELMGKRLPDDLEWLYAATDGPDRKYPWGRDEPTSWLAAAAICPVGSFALDRTPTDPPVFGLFSNVAEWTMTRPSAQLKNMVIKTTPGATDPFGVVRRGPPALGRTTPKDIEAFYSLGASLRMLMPRQDTFDSAIGFRAARSARPRYLPPAR
jgi:serine/threonine-protein kinase